MTFVSPGIYVKTFDFSDYAPALGLTVLAVIGAATKGPINIPTTITNTGALISTFGPPMLTDYAIQSALKYLEKGQRLIFVRIDSAATPAVAADKALMGVSGGTAATAGTGSITFNSAANPVASIRNLNLGTSGNVAITKSGTNITVSGMTGGSSTTYAAGSVTLTGQPSTADTVTAGDGVNTAIFEFTNTTPAGGHIAVAIGGTAAITLTNLVTAILASALNLNAAPVSLPVNPVSGDTVTLKKSAVPSLTLTNTNLGSNGNRALAATGAVVSVSGMAGGTSTSQATGTVVFLGAVNPTATDTLVVQDGASTKTFEFTNAAPSLGNIAVAIGGDAYITMATLVSTINSQSGFHVIATNTAVVKTFEFRSSGSPTLGNIAVLVGSTAYQTMQNLVASINLYLSTLGIAAGYDGSALPVALLTNTLLGTVGNAAVATNAAAYIGVVGLTGGIDAVAGISEQVGLIEASTPGSWGNAIQVQITPTVTLGAPAGNFDLAVLYPPDTNSAASTVESFRNLSLDPSSTRFVDQALAKGILGEFAASAYVRAETSVMSATATAQTLLLGQGGGTVGSNSGTLDAADYIGTVNGQRATGLQALANVETVEFNVLIIPGISDARVINAAFTLAAARNDFHYIVDPPFGLSTQQVADWHNGISSIVSNAPAYPLDTRYASLYWAWQQAFDPYNNVEVWLPPSGFVAADYAFTDSNGGPWLAPAGYTNGLVNSDDVEFSPPLSDRNILQGGSNRINPIVKTGDSGPVILGDKTLQRRLSGLDSVPTQRMLIYAQKVCSTAVKYLLFTPNDPITWARYTTLVNPILASIKAARGMAEFRVICDETTNTTDRVNQHQMLAKLLIQDLPTAEIIEQDFALLANGASFSTPA